MNAFVLMPFQTEFTDIYNLGILETAKEVGINATRLDSQIFACDMLDKIYQEIEKADLIIADMSTRNPNVFYEVGYADAKKKLVILLTNNIEDIPFDFKHRPHIVYDKNNITLLKVELNKRLTWANNELKIIQKDPLKTDLVIKSSDLIRTEYIDEGKLLLRINVYNRIDKISDKINSVYIYTTKQWEILHNNQVCKNTEEKSDNTLRHIVLPDFQVIPSNDYLPIDIELKTELYSPWEKGSRVDEYFKTGNIKIVINTETNKYIDNHYIEVKFEYFEIPF